MTMNKNTIKIKISTTVYYSLVFQGMGIPYWLPPFFCLGMPSCLGLVWSGTVVCVEVSSYLWKQGYKATLQLAAGVPL